jgi:ABC-type polysaccharide/polyol phosphate export permease
VAADKETVAGEAFTSSVSSMRWVNVGGLIWTLVRTDFKTRYHGTIGGFVWALLKPFTMFLVLMSVFSFIFASDPQYKFRLIIGLFLFDFFSEATKVGLMSLNSNGYLLAKARFPAWIVVLTSISNSLLTLVILAIVVTAFLSLGGRTLDAASIFLFLGYLTAHVLIVIGFSLAASVWFLKFRDLNQIWEVVLQAGFFVAPIVYPLNIIPERYHFYLYLWPPTPIIQFSRSVLVDHIIPTPTAHLYLFVETAVVLLGGILVFRRNAAKAAELL